MGVGVLGCAGQLGASGSVQAVFGPEKGTERKTFEFSGRGSGLHLCLVLRTCYHSHTLGARLVAPAARTEVVWHIVHAFAGIFVISYHHGLSSLV